MDIVLKKIGFSIALLFVAAHAFAQWPRFFWEQIEAADSSGRFAISNSTLDGEWNTDLRLLTGPFLRISTDTLSTRAYARSVGGGSGTTNYGSGTADYYTIWSAADTLKDGLLKNTGTNIELLAPVDLYSWTTAGRPTGVANLFGWNTTEGEPDIYNGTAWYHLVRTSDGSLTSGSVLFADANGAVAEDNSNFFWDDSGNRLAIGANSIPALTGNETKLYVYGTGTGVLDRTALVVQNASTTSATRVVFVNGDNRQAVFQYTGSGWSTGEFFQVATASDKEIKFTTNSDDVTNSGTQGIAFQPGGPTQNFIMYATKNGVSIAKNNTAASYALDVGGTGGIRISSGTTAQRPTTASAVLRYNSSENYFEGVYSTTWRPLSYLELDPSGTLLIPIGSYGYATSNTRGYQLKSNSGTYRYGLKYGNAGSVGSSNNLMLTNREANGDLLLATSGASGGAGGETTRIAIKATGNIGIKSTTANYTLDINATDGVQLPDGTTAQRPTGSFAVIRGNTDSTALEYYSGSAWETIADRDWVRSNFVATGGGYSGFKIGDDASGTYETISSGDTIHFVAGSLLDLAVSPTDEVQYTVDLSEASTVTAIQSDDYFLMYDSGGAVAERIASGDFFDRVSDSLRVGVGGIYGGSADVYDNAVAHVDMLGLNGFYLGEFTSSGFTYGANEKGLYMDGSAISGTGIVGLSNFASDGDPNYIEVYHNGVYLESGEYDPSYIYSTLSLSKSLGEITSGTSTSRTIFRVAPDGFSFIIGTNGIRYFVGSGSSPESTFSSDPGGLYSSTTAKASLWVKESGTGSTGWKAVATIASELSGQLVFDNVATASLPTGISGGTVFDTDEDRPAVYDGAAWQYPRWTSDEDFGSTTDTTSGTGYLTISHGLGVTPSFVMAARRGASGNVAVYTATSTEISVRVFDASGSSVNSTSVTVDWIVKK